MSKIRLHGTSSGYTEIAPVAASGNNTLTLPNDGTILSKDAAGAVGVTSIKSSNVNVGAAVTITESGIEASGIGITCANINGTQIGGRRNIVINGAMQVAQRGTSSTTVGYQTVDRMTSYSGGLDESPTYSQADVASGTTPYTNGFRKSFKIQNGNQTSGAGADDHMVFEYRIEDQDLATSGWNYTSATSYITMSFWVKSSVAQNFYFNFQSDNGSQYRYVMETGSLTANTWTKIIKTIPGNSNIVLNNDNGIGMYINWHLFDGTNRTGTRPLDAWAALDNTSRTPDQTSTWYTTNDATFELTGLQLEVGSQATAFEHRSFAEELPLCQRYYYRWASGSQKYLASGGYYSTGLFACVFSFPTTMRAAPTLDYLTGTDRYLIYSNGSNDGVNAISYVRGHQNGGGFDITDGASGTLGAAGFLSTNNNDIHISFTAEL